MWPESPEDKGCFSHPKNSWGLEAIVERHRRQTRFIYLETEAIKTYEVLINRQIVPSVVVVQDHGYGCFWTEFGGDSLLYRVARNNEALPPIVFSQERNPGGWPGYERASDYVVYSDREPRAIFFPAEVTAAN